MSKIKFTVGNASNIFADFESEHANYLATLKVQGYSFWQIVKWTSLQICLNSSIEKSVNSSQSNKTNTLKIIINAVLNIIKGSILFLKLKAKKYPYYLFITNSVDKLALNEQNLYYNSLMDPVIDYFSDNKIDYLHYEYNIGAKQPSYRIGAFDISSLNFLKRFYKTEHIDTNKFVEVFNNYFISKNIEASINSNQLKSIVDNFIQQKQLWLNVFKKNRPKKIFTSEITNTGFLAACNQQGIEVFEFQHGTIDKNHPAYTIKQNISANCKPLKPFAYAVFGASTMQTLKLHPFNESIHIIELGKKNIEDFRKNVQEGISKKVLLCLQPFMEDLNIDVIQKFKESNLENFSITVKFHPLQKKEEQNKITEIVEKNTKFYIAPTNEKIYTLISSHDITIAHTSNVLEECISLNKPAITIATEDTPNGMLDLLDMYNLKLALKPVFVKDLASVINEFYMNPQFKQEWFNAVDKCKNYFYAYNYCDNLLKIL